MYVSAFDLTKAYNRLNQCILILKLFDIGIPKDIIMIFLFWFKNLSAAVVWSNVKSSVFSIKSSVRQGGVCSCWMFNLYVNELIVMLEDSGYGCKLWGVLAGCILYADDILLISKSLIKLQAMLEICFNFGCEKDLLFNAKKSAYYAFRDLHVRASNLK